jgi:hypothetical protein
MDAKCSSDPKMRQIMSICMEEGSFEESSWSLTEPGVLELELRELCMTPDTVAYTKRRVECLW